MVPWTGPISALRRLLPTLLILVLLVLLTGTTSARSGMMESLFKGSWVFTDERGDKIQLSRWKGERLVITMTYTSCQKICPHLTMDKLKEIQKVLESAPERSSFVVITFDPANDTPEVLATYKKKMGVDRPNWHFLTGKLADIKEAASLLGLGEFWAMDGHINHDYKIHILDPSGKVDRVVDWQHQDVRGVAAGL